LAFLLESIRKQSYRAFEVIIQDDCSPRGKEIYKVSEGFADKHTDIPLVFQANEKNLGYDGNIRSLLKRAAGDYCLFMGDDDVMFPHCVEKLTAAIEKHSSLGIIRGGWALLDQQTESIHEIFKYFPDDRFFPAGEKSAVVLFRRSTFISGFTVHRESAIQSETDMFDGSLLYQLYLAGNILMEKDGYYISEILTGNRDSGKHFFGSSEAEKNRFQPGINLWTHSVNFMKGELDIAKYLEKKWGVPMYEAIRKDLDIYAFGYLRSHASSSSLFVKYIAALVQAGLGRHPLFWLQVISLVIIKENGMDTLIRFMKKVHGSTPRLGGLYNGERPQ
jgi:glycosyltransferase involved in cell wall biosynthesis